MESAKHTNTAKKKKMDTLARNIVYIRLGGFNAKQRQDPKHSSIVNIQISLIKSTRINEGLMSISTSWRMLIYYCNKGTP